MNNLKIWYKHPRRIHREVNVTQNNDIRRKETLIVEDTFKSTDLRIPMSPYINMEGLQDIIATKDRASYVVAGLLLTGLHSSSQKNVVSVSINELVEKSKLSKPVIIGGISKLVELEYIVKRGKQRYYISPRLGWYGNQVDWALALKEIKCRKEPSADILKPLEEVYDRTP